MFRPKSLIPGWSPVLVLYDANGRELERNTARRFARIFTPTQDAQLILQTQMTLRSAAARNTRYRLDITSCPHLDFILPPAGLPAPRPTTLFTVATCPWQKRPKKFALDGNRWNN